MVIFVKFKVSDKSIQPRYGYHIQSVDMVSICFLSNHKIYNITGLALYNRSLCHKSNEVNIMNNLNHSVSRL